MARSKFPGFPGDSRGFPGEFPGNSRVFFFAKSWLLQAVFTGFVILLIQRVRVDPRPLLGPRGASVRNFQKRILQDWLPFIGRVKRRAWGQVCNHRYHIGLTNFKKWFGAYAGGKPKEHTSSHGSTWSQSMACPKAIVPGTWGKRNLARKAPGNAAGESCCDQGRPLVEARPWTHNLLQRYKNWNIIVDTAIELAAARPCLPMVWVAHLFFQLHQMSPKALVVCPAKLLVRVAINVLPCHGT